jgi:hypothetical protein
MIRLNDKYNSRVNENDINWYNAEEKAGVYITINILICGDYEHLFYESKELRDKDIELLDKIFDVKSIEYKANEEYDFGEPQVMNPKPTKKEKYVTWKDVKRYATWVNVEFPNGEFRTVDYDEECLSINIMSNYSDTKEAIIYDEDLFNALMLKKVE